jgi:hypothetical protein
MPIDHPTAQDTSCIKQMPRIRLCLFVSFHFSNSALRLLPYVRLISCFIFGVAAENPASEIGFCPANWTVLALFLTSPISR